MNKHMKIILIQAVFLIGILIVLYMLYPKASFELTGDVVNFKAENANLIIISENPDFSNPRYLEIGKDKNVSFNLPPGIYYWKSSNGIVEGLKHEFKIESEVGLKINRNKDENSENESELVNIGNVKINVTKTKEGVMVGHIILEPDESEEITDNPDEKYTGEQREWWWKN